LGWIYKDKSFEVLTKEDGLNSDLLFGIIEKSNGEIYIATYKGVNKIENGIISNLTAGTIFEDAFSNRILLSDDGAVYAATSNGIFYEKDGILKSFTEKNGLAYNHCLSILEDDNGIIYFGTSGRGISIYDPSEKIISYDQSTDLPNESIWAILKSNSGKLYFGSVNGLIIKDDDKINLLNTQKGLSGNFIRVLKESSNGRILAGTKTGFSIIDNNEITNFTWDNKLDINQVYSIYESENGSIYLGTQTGVVIFQDDNELKEESRLISNAIQEGLNSNMIYSIAETNSGIMLFASHNGVAAYENGKYKFYTSKNGLVDNSVNTIHTRDNGTIWVGTLKGLNIIENGKVVDTIDVDDGLSNNSIADIEEDANGRIFVATYHGLNILTNFDDSLNILRLYKKDGLVEDDFTHEGTFVDNEGNLWLGTLSGISIYNPNAEKIISKPPKLYLTGFQLFNEKYSLEEFMQSPQLSHNENFLNFIYTGINLSAPDKIRYKYRLSDVDMNWVETSDNIAHYTNLDDGDYIFEVKAGNEWGYWSQPVKLSFTINPAWWETWWFYTLSVLAVGSLIAFVSSYKYRHLLAIERMRSKISADLHDSIGSGLSEISILSELLGYQVPEDKKEIKSGLGNISSISRTLIDSMGDIVWLVNPKKDTLKDLFKRLQLSYHELLKHSDTELVVENLDDLEDVKLPMNFRQHLYLIFKEAINNAIKYSGADLMKLNIQIAANNLIVIFSDNGKGFSEKDNEMGNGLINMKNRAKEIGGEINYVSEVGKGTTIKFHGKFNKLKSNLL